jgi:hypothetical protein
MYTGVGERTVCEQDALWLCLPLRRQYWARQLNESSYKTKGPGLELPRGNISLWHHSSSRQQSMGSWSCSRAAGAWYCPRVALYLDTQPLCTVLQIRSKSVTLNCGMNERCVTSTKWPCQADLVGWHTRGKLTHLVHRSGKSIPTGIKLHVPQSLSGNFRIILNTKVSPLG